ncbi:MAG: hypothetical protein MUO50_17580 [Longimicrobiales bacterium]|nr:hypothetical protein [Longimicrobiales bacterium]
MRVLSFKRFPLASIFALLTLLPLGAEGQLRTVVSNEIAVSEKEATLRLDLKDHGDLTISFQDGQVLVDGEVVGVYGRRDDLDLAWRSLLGEVITLDDGSLASALNDWDPPRELTGAGGELAARLDRTLEDALALPAVSGDAGPQGEITLSIGGEEGLLSALLSRSGALNGLAEALQGAPIGKFILKIGEDVVVEADEVMEGTLILVDGNLDIRGRIDGDVVVTGGRVRLLENGVITGDLRIADGELDRSGGTVEGSFLDMDTGDEIQLKTAEMEDLRREMEAEIRRDLRSSMPREDRHSRNFIFGFLGNVGSAIAGLLENLVTFLILAILGVLAVHFQSERLEVVATTARRAPVRSAVVGLAGGFFLIPLWIVGVIALAITIIGIPVLLAWVPLFPIAAAIAILFGYLAVARNVGEWVAEQEFRGLEWIRGSNTFYTIVAGVGALLVPCVAASAARILGLGFLTGLLGFVGSMATFAAAAVGLGAVLLTRGGKIRPLESYYDFEEDYWADVEPGPRKDAPTTSEPAPESAEPVTEPSEAAMEAEEASPDPSPPEEGEDLQGTEGSGPQEGDSDEGKHGDA